MVGVVFTPAADQPIIPLLEPHLWQTHTPNNPRKQFPMLDSTSTNPFPVGLASTSSGTATCQDCGNQAKKDCVHRRCRTCCKSRRFVCSTHLKSTWVPAARRRERQQLAAAGSTSASSGSKKPRLLATGNSNTSASHTSTSTTPRSFDNTSNPQEGGNREGLPRHVRAPAVFKCVRVTSIEDGQDEYAYQASVSIGGRVFKGFLYDQGLDQSHENDNNTTMTSIPNLSDLHLGGGDKTTAFSTSSAMLVGVPSDVFAGPGGLMEVHPIDNP